MANPLLPKMTRKQARLLWQNMSAHEKAQFNVMFGKLQKGELELKNVNVDDNEVIQNIELKPKL